MPKLKVIYDSADEIPDALRDLYQEVMDGDVARYVLQLDDDVKHHPQILALRNAYDRQKQENASLKAQVASLSKGADTVPDDFTSEEWERLKALDDEFKKGGGDDAERRRREAEMTAQRNTLQQKLDRLEKKYQTDIAERDGSIERMKNHVHRLLVEDGLTKALAEAGIQGPMLKASRAMLERSVEIIQDGDADPVAMIKTDLDPTPIGEYVKSWVQTDEGRAFLPQPSGGGASGSNAPKGSVGDNPYSKVNWNVTNQGRVYKADPIKADRLAKAAGHRDARSARLETAK